MKPANLLRSNFGFKFNAKIMQPYHMHTAHDGLMNCVQYFTALPILNSSTRQSQNIKSSTPELLKLSVVFMVLDDLS